MNLSSIFFILYTVIIALCLWLLPELKERESFMWAVGLTYGALIFRKIYQGKGFDEHSTTQSASEQRVNSALKAMASSKAAIK